MADWPLERELGETSIGLRVADPARALALETTRLSCLTIRIAEVDARALPAGARPLDRPLDDLDAERAEVVEGTLDGAVPDEAEIAVPRPHRVGRDGKRVDARPVDVELLVAEPVGEAGAALDELRAEHIPVERVRARPVGDGDHAVVECDPHEWILLFRKDLRPCST